MPPIHKVSEKPKNAKKTFKMLLHYLKPYYIPIITILIFAILSTILSIFGPKVLGKATTKLFEGVMFKIQSPSGYIDFNYIFNILAWLVLIYISSALFRYIQEYIMNIISVKISYNLRKQISEKINKLPLKYFDKNTYGDVLSRVTNDVDTISNNLEQTLSHVVSSVVTIIGVLIMMLSISPLLTLISILTLPLGMTLVGLIVSKSQKYFKTQQEVLGEINGHIEESYSSHEIIMAFNAQEKTIDKFNNYNTKLYNSAWKSQFLSGLMMPILSFIGNIGYVGVSVLGGYQVIKGRIQIGDIQAFLQYVRQFNQPVMQVSQIANVFQSVMAASERVFEFLDEKEEVKDSENTISIEELKGEVEFNNVMFGYDKNKIIISDFNAKIKPGQKVAIVGPTGAGKTTLVNLLMRFYELNSGSIKIDGVDIKNMKRSELRNTLGMVLQDTWLFNGSIKDNIAFGKLDATDEEIIEASKKAYVDHFIHTLPEGYNMIVNEEGNNISGGQKQLLTIARAFLANPGILILDEATSNVDTRTEIIIQKAMNKLMKGRTSFIIAHRLSTIRDADLILVMDNGNIVEQGNHEELLNKKGYYYNLYNSQFETKTSES
ncbi:MAG: ABC transporter ATP-binding protein [Firmicutes bacterium]|nr:ABC transporter ATP-binding protein [Bacillota bacterium]